MPQAQGVRARADLYLRAARDIHTAELDIPDEPARLEVVADILRGLAGRAEAFPVHAFPQAPGTAGGLFRLVEFPDQRAAVYMSLGVTGRKANPHTHAAWAAVAGVSGGVEHNVLYDRVDDGAVEGQGELRQREARDIGPGDVVLLPSGVFHTIEVVSDTPVLHLHAYARSVDAPTPQPLPAFESPQARTYTLRKPGGFSPPLAAVHPDELLEDLRAGAAVLLAINAEIAPGFDGPYVAETSVEDALETLEDLAPPIDTPIVLDADPETALRVAQALYRAEWPVVFRLLPRL